MKRIALVTIIGLVLGLGAVAVDDMTVHPTPTVSAHDEFGGSPYGGCPAWWEPWYYYQQGYTHWHWDWVQAWNQYYVWPHWHEGGWVIGGWTYHHHWSDPGCGFSP